MSSASSLLGKPWPSAVSRRRSSGAPVDLDLDAWEVPTSGTVTMVTVGGSGLIAGALAPFEPTFTRVGDETATPLSAIGETISATAVNPAMDVTAGDEVFLVVQGLESDLLHHEDYVLSGTVRLEDPGSNKVYVGYFDARADSGTIATGGSRVLTPPNYVYSNLSGSGYSVRLKLRRVLEA